LFLRIKIAKYTFHLFGSNSSKLTQEFKRNCYRERRYPC
jgi:hypothetical protein